MSVNAFARAAYAETLHKPVTHALEKADPKDHRIAKRAKPGSPWWVTLRPIGSWDASGRYGELLTAQVTARLQTEARVRAELVTAGRLAELTRVDADTAAARLADEVNHAVANDPALRAVAESNNRAILLEGLVGGEQEVQRLYALGGGRLLNEVLEEIHAFHTLDFETGEG